MNLLNLLLLIFSFQIEEKCRFLSNFSRQTAEVELPGELLLPKHSHYQVCILWHYEKSKPNCFCFVMTYLNLDKVFIRISVSVLGLHPAFHAQGGDCSEAQFGSSEAVHPRPQRKNLSLPRRLRFRPRRCPTGRTSPPVASNDEPPVGQAQGDVEKIP